MDAVTVELIAARKSGYAAFCDEVDRTLSQFASYRDRGYFLDEADLEVAGVSGDLSVHQLQERERDIGAIEQRQILDRSLKLARITYDYKFILERLRQDAHDGGERFFMGRDYDGADSWKYPLHNNGSQAIRKLRSDFNMEVSEKTESSINGIVFDHVLSTISIHLQGERNRDVLFEELAKQAIKYTDDIKNILAEKRPLLCLKLSRHWKSGRCSKGAFKFLTM